jgi:pentatricopeptide repeat protein
MAYTQHCCEIKAIEMFAKMVTERVSPDNIAFLGILEACSNLLSLTDGMKMHIKLMQYGFDSDVNVVTATMNLYAKCGDLMDSKWLFDHMPRRDLIAWTSMIATFVQFTRGEEALHLFGEMQREGHTPDVVCFTNALNACEIHLALLDGRLIHMCIVCCHAESEVDVVTALLFMYGRCGSLSDARAIFHRNANRSLGVWNAIIASCAQHGHGWEAFDLLYGMQQQGFTPNKTTLVIVMSACSRAGLVEEGYHCLVWLFGGKELAPSAEHADCMIDLLGRVGQVDEAEVLIDMMPFLPSVIAWAAFMAACGQQVDVKRGNNALTHLVEMDPIDPVAYIALSNLYASVSEDAEKGVMCSWEREASESVATTTCVVGERKAA